MPIERTLIFDLEAIPGFPKMASKDSEIALYQFILHGEYEPDRLKAFEIYKAMISTSFGSQFDIDLQERVFSLLNSIHASQVEAGSLLSRLLHNRQGSNDKCRF